MYSYCVPVYAPSDPTKNYVNRMVQVYVVQYVFLRVSAVFMFACASKDALVFSHIS